MKDNVIQQMTFNFSLKIIYLYKQLQESKEFVLSKQLLRSGTSIGANVEEAIAAQSKKDFVAKLSIACKEARETKYWLKLLHQSNMTNNIIYDEHLKMIESVLNILTKIVKTTKENHL